MSPQKRVHPFYKSGEGLQSLFRRPPEDYSGPPWVGGLPFSLKFDYSAEGFQRSYADSTLRLSLNRIDLLVIHDLDRGYHGDSVPEKLRQLESGI